MNYEFRRSDLGRLTLTVDGTSVSVPEAYPEQETNVPTPKEFLKLYHMAESHELPEVMEVLEDLSRKSVYAQKFDDTMELTRLYTIEGITTLVIPNNGRFSYSILWPIKVVKDEEKHKMDAHELLHVAQAINNAGYAEERVAEAQQILQDYIENEL